MIQTLKMSGSELELNSPPENARLQYMKRTEALLDMFLRLPEADQKLFTNGSYFLGINGGFCGLIANNLFRRILNVTQAGIASSLPMAVLPFLTTAAIYQAAITEPLISGDLTCAPCAIVRGGLVGSVMGGLYPIFLAIPVNAGLAARYSSAPLPGKENMLRFWIKVSQPVFKKMSFAILLQAAFGIYLSSRQYGIFMKMLQLPEELKD
ncbi:transmembrane protein 126A-like isoform X3 [Malaclemys terrapin pileata]|uniref:transmembrane protein 126A-like isoform X3 n=2 Tax=Malaclemys terrapin pileata TaxID=2991368 RepID=UPI0023A85CA9|nr:transmembrane protein 126A-like isoform X3 [Malaclemys terrapin pileata]